MWWSPASTRVSADPSVTYTSPLLKRPGAVEGGAPDAGVAAHYGNPVKEQRALDAGKGAVDLSHYSVVTITGEDRLSWLTTLSSQQLTGLQPGESSELLLLDISGRIEQAPAVTDDGETTWLITESSHGPLLASWLDSMKFMLRVEITDRSAEYAVIGSTRPLPEGVSAVVSHWEDPWPRLAPGAASYAEVDDDAHPGLDRHWHLNVIPRENLEAAVATLEEQGWQLAGSQAAEALRIAAWRPRLAREVDDKAIPHELDLIRTAVHLSKGCYKGQETVARVHNLGHPPRRLVFLHLDGTEHTLPSPGAQVLAPADPADTAALASERPVGVVTSAARHHEAGPIALALVKRKVDPAQQLVVRDVLTSAGDTQPPADAKQTADAEPVDETGAEAQQQTVFYAAAQEVIVRPDAGQAVGRPQGNFVRRPR